MSSDSAPHQSTGQSNQPVAEDTFIADREAGESGADEDDDDEDGKGKDGKKSGRRKIKIEFIADKSRRHITFSKRKAGIMKKAYELSTLTGTQVLLLVVSETGLVYTFTTAKLQPLVTQPEGKNLIQACLNAQTGSTPSNLPVGPNIGQRTNTGNSTTAGQHDDDEDDEDSRIKKRPRGPSNASTTTASRQASTSVSLGAQSVSPTQQTAPQSIAAGQAPHQQYPSYPTTHTQNQMYAPPHMMQHPNYGYPSTSSTGQSISGMQPAPHQWGNPQQPPVDQNGYRR